jgi:hypothetical protein
MFAFEIDIPEEEDGNGSDDKSSKGAAFGEDGDGGESNGEGQYSPGLLPIDICCILFGMLDFEYHKRRDVNNVDDSARWEAKKILVDVLIEYLIQIDEEHVGIQR